jgi:hypothetical protein
MTGIPTPDEAREWLKEHESELDLTVIWTETDAPGSAERHLKLLKMLFGPAEPPRAA